MNCLSKGEKMQLDKDNKNWMGKLPESWNTRKIKYVLWQRNEDNLPIKSKKILSLTAKQGVIPYEEKVGGGNKPKQNFSAYKLAYPGDIVMNSMNILSGAVGLSIFKGCVSPVYYMLRPISKADDVRFFYYVFANKAFQHSLLGIGNGILIKKSDKGTYNTIRMRIPIEKLKNLVIPYPSAEEQRTIADFLDKKCTDIDKLSTQIQKEINTLQKYRKSVITNAVTKGLDDNVPMKDSGIDWIGKIPEDWKIIPLKYTIKNKTDVLKETTDPDFEFLYVDIGSVVTGYINNYQLVRFKNAPSRARKVVRDKDVIISTVRTYLKAIASIKTKNLPIIVSTGFAVLRSNGKINPDFLKYAVENESFVSQVQINSVGINYPAISQSKLLNLKIVFPPMDVQIAINKYLDNKTYQIDRMISQKKKQLSLLSDYKNSLIFEYVTGKKQVGEE